jgi:hypothetical protein
LQIVLFGLERRLWLRSKLERQPFYLNILLGARGGEQKFG